MSLLGVVIVLLLVSMDDNEAPHASIIAYPEDVSVGETVTFDGTGSSDPDGDEIEFIWTIDGTMTTHEPNFTYSFTESGTHTIVLQVKDENGNYDTETVLLDVKE